MPQSKAKCTASRTRGRGRKKGRGAGLRGGRGNAGLLKHKIMSTIKYDPDHFGRHGFKRPQSKVAANRTINLAEVEEKLDGWLAKGKATQENELVSLDLTKLGYDKLLARGRLTRPVHISVVQASAKAGERVSAAGGELNLGA